MMMSMLFVVLGFVSVIKPDSCLRQTEKSIISNIRSTLKTLEEALASKIFLKIQFNIVTDKKNP